MFDWVGYYIWQPTQDNIRFPVTVSVVVLDKTNDNSTQAGYIIYEKGRTYTNLSIMTPPDSLFIIITVDPD